MYITVFCTYVPNYILHLQVKLLLSIIKKTDKRVTATNSNNIKKCFIFDILFDSNLKNKNAFVPKSHKQTIEM